MGLALKSCHSMFRITDRMLHYGVNLYGRVFEIENDANERVNVLVSFKDDVAMSAHIRPYYSENPPFDSGRYLAEMIRALLNHIHSQIPTIREVTFEDNTNIECMDDDAENVRVIPLYYFSIAFNGETWYEKHFNARQKDSKRHAEYKLRINSLLNVPDTKSSVTFSQFVEMTAPPLEIAEELRGYYDRSNTFGEFFQSMPKPDRCRLVRDWIGDFMKRQLAGVFENTDWIIDLPMVVTRGGARNTRKRYYCPKCRVYRNTTYQDFGVRAVDV